MPTYMIVHDFMTSNIQFLKIEKTFQNDGNIKEFYNKEEKIPLFWSTRPQSTRVDLNGMFKLNPNPIYPITKDSDSDFGLSFQQRKELKEKITEIEKNIANKSIEWKKYN